MLLQNPPAHSPQNQRDSTFATAVPQTGADKFLDQQYVQRCAASMTDRLWPRKTDSRILWAT